MFSFSLLDQYLSFHYTMFIAIAQKQLVILSFLPFKCWHFHCLIAKIGLDKNLIFEKPYILGIYSCQAKLLYRKLLQSHAIYDNFI